MLIQRFYGLLGVMLVAVGFLSGCVGLKPGGEGTTPAWVKDPLVLVQMYPRRDYMVGYGLSAGTSENDLLGRREAENKAFADIAAGIEVRIQTTRELMETDIVQDGRGTSVSVLHETTRRQVGGILTGAEVVGRYFERKTLTWHVVAVLERARAGRLVQEKIERLLEEGTRTLSSLPDRDLDAFFRLKRLQVRASELDWLATAVGVFTPQRSSMIGARVTTFRTSLDRHVEETRQRLRLKLSVTATDNQPVPGEVNQTILAWLSGEGIRVGDDAHLPQLRIKLQFGSADEIGAVRLTRVWCTAHFAFLEKGSTLVGGKVGGPEVTAVRTGNYRNGRSLVLKNVQILLMDALRKAMTGDAEQP